MTKAPAINKSNPQLKGGNVRHSNDNVKPKQEGQIASKKTNP